MGMFGEGTTFDPNTGIIEGDKPPTIDLGVAPSQLDPLGEISFNQLRSRVFDTLTNLGKTPSEAFGLLKDITFKEGGFSGLDELLQSFNTPFTGIASTRPEKITDEGQDFTVGQSLGTGQVFTGGGVGFQGGFVSETPITTLFQVLDLFPQLTASQAADFLSQFKGLSPSEAILQDPDIKNISGDPSQPITILPASQESLTGLTPEAIFALLFPNVKSNF